VLLAASTSRKSEESADTPFKPVREEVLEGLTFLGVQIDKEKNNVRGKVAEISTADSKVKAFVIPTDEEVMIARDTYNLSK